MYTSTLLLSLLPVALAQYGGGGSSPSPSPSSASSTAAAAPATKTAAVPNGVQVVMVSNPQGDLQFTPNSFNASVGSTVEFQFYPPTHSISQAAFDSPCTPLNNTGFFSGGVTTTGSGPNAAQAYSITINDTTPIWFYCSFPTHCETGMVGVINPPADGSKTLAQFKSAAANVKSTVPPPTVQGGVLGPIADVKGSGTAASSSASPTSSKPSAGSQSRGSVQWALLGLTGLIAAGVSGLLL